MPAADRVAVGGRGALGAAPCRPSCALLLAVVAAPGSKEAVEHQHRGRNDHKRKSDYHPFGHKGASSLRARHVNTARLARNDGPAKAQARQERAGASTGYVRVASRCARSIAPAAAIATAAIAKPIPKAVAASAAAAIAVHLTAAGGPATTPAVDPCKNDKPGDGSEPNHDNVGHGCIPSTVSVRSQRRRELRPRRGRNPLFAGPPHGPLIAAGLAPACRARACSVAALSAMSPPPRRARRVGIIAARAHIVPLWPARRPDHHECQHSDQDKGPRGKEKLKRLLYRLNLAPKPRPAQSRAPAPHHLGSNTQIGAPRSECAPLPLWEPHPC